VVMVIVVEEEEEVTMEVDKYILTSIIDIL
jgi:hypothetical protein